MILENNRKAFQELQNRIIGKILSIIASSLAVLWFSKVYGLYPSRGIMEFLGLRHPLRVQYPYTLENHGTTITSSFSFEV